MMRMAKPPTDPPHPLTGHPPAQPAPRAVESQLAVDVCPHCSESVNLALIKGCLRCMRCGFKWDCNGW